MLLKIPGARVTDTGAPVPVTISPGLIPLVSSYTWIVVFSEVSPMTSPTRFSLPTYTISFI